MGSLFIALKEQKTTNGLHKINTEMPELLEGDAAGALALVDAGAVEWRGSGGKYGPFTRDAVQLRSEMSERTRARESKVTKIKAAPRNDADALKLAIRDLGERNEDLAHENNALKARLDALEARTNLGSAPAPKPDPSPNKGGR